MRRLATTVLAAAALTGGALVVTAPTASAADCAVSRSADGHRASVTCTGSGAGHYYIRATACNAGGCRVLTGNTVTAPGTSSINAGSAYIDQSTITVVHY